MTVTAKSAPAAPDVRRVNYHDANDALALVHLLDLYARDPMGGGEALSETVCRTLPEALCARSDCASFIAWLGDEPVGLINCIEGFSTFKARPLMNIHDLTVAPGHRGRGIGHALLAAAERWAHERGCCKLTLEVLSGNAVALRSYLAYGFANYQLDPSAGQAQFMQKWL